MDLEGIRNSGSAALRPLSREVWRVASDICQSGSLLAGRRSGRSVYQMEHHSESLLYHCHHIAASQ